VADGEVTLDMCFYLDCFLEGFDNLQAAVNPLSPKEPIKKLNEPHDSERMSGKRIKKGKSGS
jgi:hypothetical protein